jgi:integrase
MRNQNGFGSIVCLDKTGKKRRKPWAVRITTGWKGGRQERKYLGYYRTQAEALIALAEYHKNGVDIDLTKVTLKELFDKWLEDQDKRKISDSAKRNHLMAYQRLGSLGEIPINKIKAVHLQKWMDDIDLKPSTKIKIRSTMNMIFDYATQNDIVSKNYAKFIKIEEKIEKTGSIFTDEEIQALWKHSEEPIARMLLILIYTGMRIGELLQMNKDTIHLDECYMVGGSKTEAGKDRVIPIHNDILPLVKMQLGDNKWLYQTSKGNPTNYSNLSPVANKYMLKLGMNHKFHDARKTAISLMHTAGIPMETIKIIVGHAGTDVTEKVYLYKNIHELVETVNRMKIKK